MRKTGIVAKKRGFSMEVRLVASVGQINAVILLHTMYTVVWELNTAFICSMESMVQASWEGLGRLKYGPRYRSPQTIFQILQQYIASQCGIEAFNALGWLAGVVCMALGRRCSFDHSELHFFAAFYHHRYCRRS